jgi:hypothetical protein
MIWYVYQFINKTDKKDIRYLLLKNKTISEVKYNIRSGRTKNSVGITKGNLQNYEIVQADKIDASDKHDAQQLFEDKYDKGSQIPNDNDDSSKNNNTNPTSQSKFMKPNVMKFIDNIPDISVQSKKTYKQSMSQVFRIYKTNDLRQILDNGSELLKELEKQYNLTTTKILVDVILNIATKIGISKEKREQWLRMEYDIRDKFLDHKSNQRLQELSDTRASLRVKVDNKMDVFTQLILLLHIEHVKRDDFTNLKVFKNVKEAKEAISTPAKKAAFVKKHDGTYAKKGNVVTLLNYKNSKRHGDDEFKITNPRLKTVITKSFELRPDRLLLIERESGEMYRSLGSIVKRELGVTLNDLRKIYTKEVGVYDACKNLKHTVDTHHMFYKRD